MDDPDTSQGEHMLPPPDWSDDQMIVVDTAYEKGWTLERVLAAAKYVTGGDLVDADKAQTIAILEYIDACDAGDKICEAEYLVESQRDGR